MISNQGENLGFLFSMPRSGSTILSLLLGSHSKILCPPEPWFLLKVSVLTQQTDSNSVFNDEFATIGTKEFLHDNIFIEATRAFAATAYNKHLLAAGKTIFVDKTPRYFHILPLIDKLFPKSRKIWLKRNPLDVALSYKTAWNLGVEEITGQKLTEVSFDFAMGLFNLEAYFNDSSPDKLEIHYEEVVKSPLQNLTRICEFLNIQFEEAMLDYAQNREVIDQHRGTLLGDKRAPATSSVHAQSIGKWASKLSLTEIRQIVELLGFDIFRRMGYNDTVDTLQSLGIKGVSETEAAEARRRICAAKIDKLQQLNLQLNQLRYSWSWRITKPLRIVQRVLRG